MLLNAISSYCTWADSNGTFVGITVNFEEADDTHCELLAEDWILFQEKILQVKKSDNFDAELSRATEKGWLEFSEKLKENGIPYNVMSSWEPTIKLEDSELLSRPVPEMERMGKEEIRRRLSSRAAEYLMFMDD